MMRNGYSRGGSSGGGGSSNDNDYINALNVVKKKVAGAKTANGSAEKNEIKIGLQSCNHNNIRDRPINS